MFTNLANELGHHMGNPMELPCCQALRCYDTVEQLQAAWDQDPEKCLEAVQITCPAKRQRVKQRWVQAGRIEGGGPQHTK